MGSLHSSPVPLSLCPSVHSVLKIFFGCLQSPSSIGQILNQLLTDNPPFVRPLLYQLGNDSCSDRLTALAQGKPQALSHGNGVNKFDFHRRVIARHHHLHVLGQQARPCHVGRTEKELRPVMRKKKNGEGGRNVSSGEECLSLGAQDARRGLLVSVTPFLDTGCSANEIPISSSSCTLLLAHASSSREKRAETHL